LTHSPETVIHSPAEIAAGLTDDGHQISVAPRPGSEDAKSVLFIVKGDALHQAGQHFLR
jgi:hypothetical protein